MGNKFLILALAFGVYVFVPGAASADATSTDLAATTGVLFGTSTPDAAVFCAHVGDFGQNVRTEAAMKAAEHRADMDRLTLMRDEEKKKVAGERVEQRAKEDAARDALLLLLREQATSSEQLAVIDNFSSTTAKLLADLRVNSDKARESYAKVTRSDSLVERAARDRALDAYIANLDSVNAKAQGDCGKGIGNATVLAKYNAMIRDAKSKLAHDLKTSPKAKKVSPENRAKDAHLAELARLDRDYRASMQAEIAKLIAVFPDFFNTLIATSTPEVIASSTATSTSTTIAQ